MIALDYVANSAWLRLCCGLKIVAALMVFSSDGVALADDAQRLAPLVTALLSVNDPAVQADLLTGARDGLKGRRDVAMPKEWPTAYAKLAQSSSSNVRDLALELALLFGDPQALVDLRRIVLDRAGDVSKRIAAVDSLADKRMAGLPEFLHPLLDDSAIRLAAIRGLAKVPHHATPGLLLARYEKMSTVEKTETIATLVSRREFAVAMLDAMENKRLPHGDVSAFAARQLASIGDPTLTKRLREVWGEIRETPKQKQEQIEQFKKMLGPNTMKRANLSAGRLVFSKTCQQCHVLFGEGGKIGPELTGSNRANLDYILSNIVDPSAEIGRGYRMSIVVTNDGRVLTGIIAEQDEKRITVQMATERITLPKKDVEEIRDSPLSMMPEGQLEKLTPEQIRDLIGYLASKNQVTLPTAP